MKAKDNPLAVDRVLRIRYRPQECTWDELLDRLAALDYRAAIVGNHGAGKSTLLEDLAARLDERDFRVKSIRLNRDEPRFERASLRRFFDRLAPRDIILFDGAEQLGWLAWKNFLRRSQPAAGLIITTHQPGRLPTLIHCRTSAALLQRIVADLVGERAGEMSSLVEHLFEKHRGNLRDALRELYDCLANGQLTSSGPSTDLESS